MLIGQVTARLRRDHVPAGDDGAVKIGGVDPANDKVLRTFGDLVTLLEAELGDDTLRSAWVAGSAVTRSINALLRRLRSAVKPLSPVIRVAVFQLLLTEVRAPSHARPSERPGHSRSR
jgi:uncharacterized protein